MAVATGVTDIRLQLSFLSNRKIKTLRRSLGSDGVLSLIELWCHAAANDPDGLLLGWTEQDIEAVASWTGEQGAFVNTAVSLGLLEKTSAGYAIHDWAENQPFVVGAPARSEAGRSAANARWDKWRKAEAMRDACDPHTDGMPDAYATHADGNAPPSLPPILPPILPPSPPIPRKRGPRAQAPAADSLFRFAELIAIYPADKAKPDAEARRWWGKNATTDAQVDLILANTRVWLAGSQYQSGKGWNIGRYLSEGMVFSPPGKPVNTAANPPRRKSDLDKEIEFQAEQKRLWDEAVARGDELPQ